MATKGTTPQKKASASTEVVLGQAAQQISKVVAEMNSASATLGKLATQSDELTLLVANKEDQIVALETEYAEKARQAKVDLEVSMKANTESVVNEYLASVGKVAISKAELTALTKELTDTKVGAEAETKRQVAIVTNTLSTQYANDKRFAESENKAVIAENASKIGVLQEKNKFLEEQTTKLFLQLEAERAAGVERAKAGSVGNINVTSDRK
jgi:hypothetical protein